MFRLSEVTPQDEAVERPRFTEREVISIRETLDELGRRRDARCAGRCWWRGKAGGARCFSAAA